MKKHLSRAVAMLIALALTFSLCGCSMGLSEMLIVKRAYRHVADMDSVSFTAAGDLDASVASIPLKARVDADCRCIIDPGTLYMDLSIDMGKLGTLSLPVYLFTQDDALQLRIGLGEGDSVLWLSTDFPLAQGTGEGSKLDVEAVLTMLQDDPEALSIGDSETVNGILCRPFILKLPGSLLMEALGAASAQEGAATIEDTELTIWIAEDDGSPVRLSADLASVLQYILDTSDSAFLPQLQIKSLPAAVDITGFNDVDSIELPDAA